LEDNGREKSFKKGFERDSITGSDTTNNVSADSIGHGATILYTFNYKELDSLIYCNAPIEEKLKVIGYEDGDSNFSRIVYSQAYKLYCRKGRGIMQSFYDTIPIALFFLLPLFALLLKLLIYKNNSYSHHLVFSLYYFSFLFAVYSIMIIAGFIIDIPGWLKSIVFLSVVVYLWISVVKFFEKRYWNSLLKTIILLIIYLIILVPISVIVMTFITFLLY